MPCNPCHTYLTPIELAAIDKFLIHEDPIAHWKNDLVTDYCKRTFFFAVVSVHGRMQMQNVSEGEDVVLDCPRALDCYDFLPGCNTSNEAVTVVYFRLSKYCTDICFRG